MANSDFGERDLVQIAEHGLNVDEVRRQLGLFRQPPPHIQLDRPCGVGDGIRVLSQEEKAFAGLQHEEASRAGRLLKFVPASGAASRMFKGLLAIRGGSTEPTRERLETHAASDDPDARELLTFVDGVRRFAFFDDLSEAMKLRGLNLEVQLERGGYKPVLDYLLTPQGLDYAALPKGLIKFHRYGSEGRTPFEEHLVEAAQYVRDREGLCRVHFTVSPQHREGFVELLRLIRPRCERETESRFEVGFSLQKDSTDTIAVDAENQPFRNGDGKLLFRPGGHGALIENLNDLKGDIVFIKNIDNVLPDYRKAPSNECKRLLAGHLVAVQQMIFAHLSALLNEEASTNAVKEADRFAREELHLDLIEKSSKCTTDERRRMLIRMLHRPLRVCGVVRNTGEPGGGPFWVRGRDETLSLQIVESAQVDRSSAEQQAIFRKASHFNPVDLVCGVRDWQGTSFDLTQFVDPDAVFLSEKSQHGRRLKALELPGLWNGAMADWTTIFVEVPVDTFSPVKTVNDLLRPEHQPEEA